jgi:hypothetical protein
MPDEDGATLTAVLVLKGVAELAAGTHTLDHWHCS